MHALLIPFAMQVTANAVGHVLDPDTGGGQSWRVGVSDNGQAPATHYVASYPFSPDVAALIEAADAAPLHAALLLLAAERAREFPLSLLDLQALRDAMQIHTGSLRDALATWGQQFIVEAED